MKKAIIWTSLGILSILIFGIIIFLSFKPQSILTHSGFLEEVNQVSSDQNSYVYSLQAKPKDGYTASAVCSSNANIKTTINEKITFTDYNDNFAESGQGINVEIPSDVQTGVRINATTSLNGISFLTYNPNCQGNANPSVKDLGSYCIVEDKDTVTCYVIKEYTTSPNNDFHTSPYGLNLIDIKLTLPRGSQIPIILPSEKPKPLWINLISVFKNWITNLISFIKGGSSQTIVGSSQFLPGTTQVYQIDLSTNVTDSDCSDGICQIQYGSWALFDKNNQIIDNGTFEEVNGNYVKSVSIQIPQKIEDYVLVGTIIQYDLKYDLTTNTWAITNENNPDVLVQEGYNLRTQLPVPIKPKPSYNIFTKILQGILNWFKNLFT